MNDTDVIRTRLKEIIAHVAGLDPARIPDEATLRADLNLDSLSLLEIGVDVDYNFQLGLADDRYREIDSLPAMVGLVQERLDELARKSQAVEG
jgi:acyl carrier protein